MVYNGTTMWYNSDTVSCCVHMFYAEKKRWIFLGIQNPLARWVLKSCAKLVEFVRNIVDSEEFLARHRLAPSHFTRHRKLPFSYVIAFLLNQLRASLQTELDRFFKAIESAAVPVRRVSDSALCQARKKFSHRAFVELYHRSVKWFYCHADIKRWKGFRLIAFDGSTCRLPNTESNRKHFGEATGDIGDPVAMARVSWAFDVLNDIILDARIEPYQEGERAMALKHLDSVGPDALLLCDRGYVATWFVHALQAQQRHFCCRVSPDQYTATKAFRDSGRTEDIILLPPSRFSRNMYEMLGLPFKAIRVRIVRVSVPVGEDIFLLTSLPHPVEDFEDLYRNRWPVEEQYKLVKCRIEIERFSGLSAESVYQDFHATILLANLTSMLSFSARREVEENQGPRRHPRRMNWTQVFGQIKDSIVLLLLRESIDSILDALRRLFLSSYQTFRPGRKFPRRKRRVRRIFHMAYKPAY